MNSEQKVKIKKMEFENLQYKENNQKMKDKLNEIKKKEKGRNKQIICLMTLKIISSFEACSCIARFVTNGLSLEFVVLLSNFFRSKTAEGLFRHTKRWFQIQWDVYCVSRGNG